MFSVYTATTMMLMRSVIADSAIDTDGCRLSICKPFEVFCDCCLGLELQEAVDWSRLFRAQGKRVSKRSLLWRRLEKARPSVEPGEGKAAITMNPTICGCEVFYVC